MGYEIQMNHMTAAITFQNFTLQSNIKTVRVNEKLYKSPTI